MQDTNNNQPIQLTAKNTKLNSYIVLGTLIIIVPIIIYTIYSLVVNFQTNIFVFLLILVALAIFCIYVYQNLAEAQLHEDYIIVKKANQQEKSFPIHQIKDVKVYENRKDKYILVTIQGEQKSETYLLASSKLFHKNKGTTTEALLTEIVENNKKINR